MLMEFEGAFDRAGSVQDFFEIIHVMGKRWGRRMVQPILAKEAPYSNERLDRLDPETKKIRLGLAGDVVETISTILFNSGISAVEGAELMADESGSPEKLLAIRVEVRKHGSTLTSNDRLSMHDGGCQQFELLRDLARGCALTQSEEEHELELEARYKRSEREFWDLRMSGLDWFVLGVYAEVLRSLLVFLEPDEWVNDCKGGGDLKDQALYSSFRLQVIRANDDVLHAKISYRFRKDYQYDDPSHYEYHEGFRDFMLIPFVDATKPIVPRSLEEGTSPRRRPSRRQQGISEQ